jgi:transposase
MSQHSAETNPYDNTAIELSCVLTPFQRKLLTKALQTELRLEYRQRIEIMLLADQGHSQTQICEILGCCHQTARHWITMAQTGRAHQWSDRQIGRPKTVDERYLNRLKELASKSPREFGYPFQRWTAQWLKKHLVKETGIQVTEQHINRLLKEMGLSTRPHKQSASPGTESTSIAHPDSEHSDSERSSILIRDLHQSEASDISWLSNLFQPIR